MADLVKVHVNITRKHADVVQRESEIDGDSRTDVINRAISIYGQLREMQREGAEIVARTITPMEITDARGTTVTGEATKEVVLRWL